MQSAEDHHQLAEEEVAFERQAITNEDRARHYSMAG